MSGGTLAKPSIFSRPTQESRWKRGRSDRRYGLARWRKTRARILVRDGHRCFVRDCPRTATVVDHIEPVTADMPDSLFYDPRNLRAACPRHNAARGWQTYAARELGAAPAVGTRKPRVY